MVHLIPPEPKFASAAERDVWSALRMSLRPCDVLVANRWLSDEHGDAEADLIVALPDAGIVVIEVKGGSVTFDGQYWRQHDAGGHRSIDPVAQARRAKYALQTYLGRDPRWTRRGARFGHLVAFPYSRIDAGFALPDCPRSMVLDRHDLELNPAGLVWDGLMTQETGAHPIREDDVPRLLECLAGRMLPQRDLAAVVADSAAQADLLTEPQAMILRALGALNRVEVRGGAGSGKTWLAVDQARRLTQEGQRVGLLCYSRGLAAFLQRRVETIKRQHRPAYVGTFHGLGREWGGPTGTDDDGDFWENRLPAAMCELAADLPVGKRFDAFVVDEAQDFADAWWPALLAGFKVEETGGLYVFVDDGQRVFARAGGPPVPLVPVLLEENLRNTVQIAQSFGPLAAMRMRLRGGDGPPVTFVECGEEEALGAADDAVEELLDAGWAPGDVALLTTGRRHPEQVERQGRGQDSYWSSFWDADQVFYGHVLGFKGLERAAVVLAVNGFGGEERAKEKLYVGLSRARDRLVVCGDPNAIAAVAGDEVLARLRAGG
ncbi:MAG: NERD domain-containing protein [Sporichthyaceae bacterium]